MANIIANTITSIDDNSPVLINANEVKKDIEVLGCANYQTVDFLRSKGYYIGDGTEVSFGWVKLKEVK